MGVLLLSKVKRNICVCSVVSRISPRSGSSYLSTALLGILNKVMNMNLIVKSIILLAAHVAYSCSMAINSESARQYLGQFHYRNWNERRRLIIVRGDDDKVGRALSEATYNYRCELAVRHINLILLGTSKATETQFLLNQDSQTQDLSAELGEGLRSRYSDLGDAPFWAVLIGYDGGRKMVFRTDVDFPAIFSRIDTMPMRRREMADQRQQGISCN